MGQPTSGGEQTAVQRGGLNALIGQTFLEVTPGGPSQLVSYSWIAPDQEYAIKSEKQFGPPHISRVKIAADGSLAIALEVTGVSSAGQLDARGLPSSVNESGGKQWQTRLEPTATGFTVIGSENVAKPGKAAKWKERRRSDRRPISELQARALSSKWAEERKARWAPLASLVGKTWYCAGLEPTQWIKRKRVSYGQGMLDRSPPTMRLTRAEWTKPYESIVINTVLGDGRKWTDTVTLLPDGRFHMKSDGVEQFGQLFGTYNLESKAIEFPLGRYNAGMGIVLNNQLLFWDKITVLHDGFADGSGEETMCRMEEFDEARLPEWEKHLASYREVFQISIEGQAAVIAEAARDEARAKQSAAMWRGELMRELFVGIPQAVAEVQQQNNELDRLRRAAQEANGSGDIRSAASLMAGRPAQGGNLAGQPTGAIGSGTRATDAQGQSATRYVWCVSGNTSSAYSSQIASVGDFFSRGVQLENSQAFTAYLASQNYGAFSGSECYVKETQDQIESWRSEYLGNAAFGKVVNVPWSPQ